MSTGGQFRPSLRGKTNRGSAPGEGVANSPLADPCGAAPSDLQGGRDFGPTPLARESPSFLCPN